MAKKRQPRSSRSKAKTAPPPSFRKVPGFLALHQQVKAGASAIVKEIIDEMNLTLASVGKSFTAGALDEWKPKLTSSVFARLMDGGNWANDRTNVLAVAHDMAIIASIISGTSPAVAKGRVHAAFRAVKDHATCPVNPGGGRWCDFDI